MEKLLYFVKESGKKGTCHAKREIKFVLCFYFNDIFVSDYTSVNLNACEIFISNITCFILDRSHYSTCFQISFVLD